LEAANRSVNLPVHFSLHDEKSGFDALEWLGALGDAPGIKSESRGGFQMKRSTIGHRGVSIVLCMAGFLFLAMAAVVSAQETTGGIRAYVKDKTGAVVPKATVELSGSGLIAPRTLTADDAGYVFFEQVPPGEYALSASSASFRTFRVSGIKLDVGKTPTFELGLELGEVSQTIEVTSTAVLIDVTSSNVSTAIPQDVIDNIPKGRSFQSLIPFAPGARQEPLQSSRVDRGRSNGFQIDGASDSENTYLVEGLDTSNIQNGGVKQGVIFEFVQEVQVKTSGLEAQYGGAMGGVVNVVQKRGSNQWHGGLVTYYRNNAFDSNDVCAPTPQPVVSESVVPPLQQRQCGLRYDPATTFDAGARLDQAANYYVEKQDQYSVIEPGYEIGGPLVKNKLWLFSSYVPTLDKISRTVNFTGKTSPGPHTFTRSNTVQNMLNRLDYQPFSKLHLFASWQYGYSRIRGQLAAEPDSVTGQANPIAKNDPASYRPDAGSVNPSNIFDFGGDWSINSHTVATARYGDFYYDSQDRGLPAGVRYIYQNALTGGTTTSPIFAAPTPIVSASDPSCATFCGQTGSQNISANLTTLHDIFSRKSFSTDLSYSVSKWGTHNFKVGYTFNHLANDVFQSINSALINVFWGQPYTASTPTGINTGCPAVVAYNNTNYPGSNSKCAGLDGYFTIMDGITTVGNASSYNHGLYLQDGWTVGHGLTINAGVRFDKEYLPPYSPGNPSINFGWTSKVAPRIGGAYDLFHNGKLKLFASYGKFYDIMKYSLPRGSFGGEYWHDCVYAMDTVNPPSITPTSPGGHACGPTQDPSAGVTVGRFIENINWRAPAGNPADPGVDPNMKPMSQHEFLVGGDWAITPNLGVEVRYARKRLDNAIDDQSIDDSTYYIGNPGPNTYSDLLHRPLPAAFTPSTAFPTVTVLCPTCPPAPPAIRRYDGLESRVTYRLGTKFFGSLTYTYSRLTGNYSGLTDTDITDGNGGRHNANNNRSFDLPEMQYTTSGKVMDGPLSTDRPNVLTMVGYYKLKWWGMESTFGVNQIVAQGSPKSTCVPVIDSTSSCQYWDQRSEFANLTRDPATGNIVLGSLTMGARMPKYLETDFNFGHQFSVSKTNEAMKLGFEWNVLNLFNNDSVLAVNPNPFAQANEWLAFDSTANWAGYDFLTALTGYDPVARANAQTRTLNSQYGLPFLFQNRRTMRMAIRFTF
jgi:hypothetical protein